MKLTDKKILSILCGNWKNLNFSNGTLHYMKQNTQADKPFSLNQHIVERLME